jgi:hypothetical protein
LGAGLHNVSVSDVDHITSEPKSIFVIEDSLVVSVFPTSGSVFGGTRVTLSLSHSPSKLFVRFGNLTSLTAVLLSDKRAEVFSPRFHNSSVYIFVSVDGSPFKETAFRFAYYNQPVISFITPTFLSSLSTTVCYYLWPISSNIVHCFV